MVEELSDSMSFWISVTKGDAASIPWWISTKTKSKISHENELWTNFNSRTIQRSALRVSSQVEKGSKSRRISWKYLNRGISYLILKGTRERIPVQLLMPRLTWWSAQISNCKTISLDVCSWNSIQTKWQTSSSKSHLVVDLQLIKITLAYFQIWGSIKTLLISK